MVGNFNDGGTRPRRPTRGGRGPDRVPGTAGWFNLRATGRREPGIGGRTEMAKKPYIIALEEHYQDPEVKQLSGGPGAGREIVERLDDLGALRIREMGEGGHDPH